MKLKFFYKTNLFQDRNIKDMVKRIKSFFNIHSYKKNCNIELTANFTYVRNYSTTLSYKINVGGTVFNLFEIALDKIFVSKFN